MDAVSQVELADERRGHDSVDIAQIDPDARSERVSICFTAKIVPPRRTSHIVSEDDLSSYQSRTRVTPRTTAVARAVGAKSADSRRQITRQADDKLARH
ncbi:MAG: hypothetical protein ACRDPA_21050 [Solirubrobacteraceae bacterium]